MKFETLAIYLQKLETISSRLEITRVLTEVFRESGVQEINMVVNLILGRIAPNYESNVFNIADKMAVKAVAKCFNSSPEEVGERFKQLGDLGLVTYELAKNSSNIAKQLTVKDVYHRLCLVAEYEGEGSQDKKMAELADLISSLDPIGAKFATRIPLGKLRLGFSDKTIIDALSWMIVGDKSLSSKITLAYEVLPDVGLIAEKIKKGGIGDLASVDPVVGVPVLPMLAQRLKSPKEMIAKMGEVAVEPKYDGLRVLIHFKRPTSSTIHGKGFVKTFTRNLNETSWMFPEVHNIPEFLNCDEAILDSEAIGLDETTKKLANFQNTMKRRRKHDIEKVQQDFSIKFFVFDILSKDGTNLMKKPLSQRRKTLESVFKPSKIFNLIGQITTSDPQVIEDEHKKFLALGLEGVIVKKLDSQYVPGRTGWRWVKMKEIESAKGKLADTLDCLVMGYTRGKGKRAEFGMGQFLAGVRDGDDFKTITKVGTGLTDEQLTTLAKRLKQIKSKSKPKGYIVHKDLEPDFWVEPEVVVELAADEITKSPNHTSGYALRFPRLVTIREDKSPQEVTTIEETRNF